MLRYISIAVVYTFICGCNNKSVQVLDETKKPFEAIGITPNPDSLVPPKVTIVDTCIVQPQSFPIPSKPLTFVIHRGDQKWEFHLEPPVTKPADFHANVTNYGAEQGVYSGITAIAKDKAGNIWLGTNGAGVTRYDGRSFTNYTAAQGLASNQVLCIATDRMGNIWIGSLSGVTRYDGSTFKNYSTEQGLVDNEVNVIKEDKNGNIWIATAKGLSRYDPRKDTGKADHIFTNYTQEDGLRYSKITSILEDRKGSLWFGNSDGISHYNGGKGESKDANMFTNYRTAYAATLGPKGLTGDIVQDMAEDNSGNLWLATNGGLMRFNPKQDTGTAITLQTVEQGITNNNVVSVIQDKTNKIWLATDSGANCYNGTSFTAYTTAQGFSGNDMTSIAEDKRGNIWFGTWTNGLNRYEGEAFRTYTTAQGIGDNAVMSMMEDKNGNLWFGTLAGGVSRYDGGSFVTYTKKQGISGNYIQGIAQDRKGDIWFATDEGASRYDGRFFTWYRKGHGLAGNNVFAVTEDRNGDIWFGTTSRGISRYDGKTFTNYGTGQGLASNVVLCMLKDRSGNVWTGTADGLSRYNGKTFTNYTTAQGLGGKCVNSLAEDKAGNIWIGTDDGVSRFDGKAFINYTTANGLVNNSVMAIAEDHRGMLWFGTNEGLSGLTGFSAAKNSKTGNLLAPVNKHSSAALFEKYTPVFETYNIKNGYPVKDINLSAIFVDSKGIIWIGTSDKLVRLDPAALHKNKEPLPVFISAVKIGGESISWRTLSNEANAKDKKSTEFDSMAVVNEEISTFGSVLHAAKRDSMRHRFAGMAVDSIMPFYPVPIGLVVPYGHNSITIDFGAAELARPANVKYQYILEGYDKEWSPLTDRTSATFGNIPEGNYTFKLKTQSPEGVWSEPVSYTFTVSPPWYRTWWAYLLYLAAGIYAIRSIVRWRTASLRKEKEHLEEVVTERTAEVVKEKQKSDDLLLNILPAEVAEELKHKGESGARLFDDVTVLFTDFVGFTTVSEKLTPKQLVDELHSCFTAFDGIMGKYGIEKIKTVGDAYLAVSGLPVANVRHAQSVISAALEIKDFMLARKQQRGDIGFNIRIGVHSGNVVAGIVGVKKFAYDIWGDTVNTAARMEQNSEAGKINISQTTYEQVKDKFTCIYRGEIDAKNKGMLKMYFVESAVAIRSS